MLTHGAHGILLVLMLLGTFTGFVRSQSRAESEEIKVTTFFRDKTVDVSMAPDPDFAKVQGKYKVELKERNVASINAEFKNLPSVFELQGTYSTYVLWAIRDDGSTVRLAQIPSSREGVTNREYKDEVQLTASFGLILTAEPHHLVDRPSQAIVLKSGAATGSNAVRTTEKRVLFPLNQTDYFEKRPKPNKKDKAYKEFIKTPFSLLAAQYAIRYARLAGADNLAPDKLSDAESAFEQATKLFQSKANEKELDVKANDAIGFAANAEKLSVEARKTQKIEQEKTTAASTLDELREELRETKSALQQMTDRYEKAQSSANTYLANFNDKESQNRRFQDQAAEAIEKANRLDAENRKLQFEIEKLKDDVSRLRSVKEFADELPVLEVFLKNFGTVQRKPNSVVVVLPENYWRSPESAEFSDANLENLDALIKKLTSARFIQVRILSSAISIGNDATTALAWADARSAALADHLKKSGVEESRVSASSTVVPPVAPARKTSAATATRGRIEIEFMAVGQ